MLEAARRAAHPQQPELARALGDQAGQALALAAVGLPADEHRRDYRRLLDASPIGAVAKFAAAGKTMNKKDIALQAIAYGNVYVARVAMGADPQQTLRAFREAEAYEGPSLIIAYSHCVAHGYDMRQGLDQQYRAVASGHWPLIRFDPVVRAAGDNPFLLDSSRPRMSLGDYRKGELRFRALAAAEPTEAERLLDGLEGASQGAGPSRAISASRSVRGR